MPLRRDHPVPYIELDLWSLNLSPNSTGPCTTARMALSNRDFLNLAPGCCPYRLVSFCTPSLTQQTHSSSIFLSVFFCVALFRLFG